MYSLIERAKRVARQIRGRKKWSEMFPNGRTIFYEGDDPEGFVAEIKEKFCFDPSLSRGWNATLGYYSFHCPAEHLDEVYGSGKYPMGS